MDLDQLTDPHLFAAAVGWLYFCTNGARVFTYLPQILAVWRCHDGAQSISLLTWSSWVVSHLAAILYASIVIHDAFFTGVSAINFVCCLTVTSIAWHKRQTGSTWER